jgi:hypothetical protein
MAFLRYFLCVLGAALLSALLGGLFAAGIAVLSPEFVQGLFSPSEGTSLARYAAAVGMIWGLFLGTGVMGFCLGLVTLVQIVRIWRKKADKDETTAT